MEELFGFLVPTFGVAFRRLIKFGYIEETDTGIKATAEGKRALKPSPSS